MNRTPEIMLSLILLLSCAAATLVTLDEPNVARNPSQAAEFQQLVRGLGFGPTVDMDEDECWFDPRQCPARAAASDMKRDEMAPWRYQLDPMFEHILPAPAAR